MHRVRKHSLSVHQLTCHQSTGAPVSQGDLSFVQHEGDLWYKFHALKCYVLPAADTEVLQGFDKPLFICTAWRDLWYKFHPSKVYHTMINLWFHALKCYILLVADVEVFMRFGKKNFSIQSVDFLSIVTYLKDQY